MKLTVLALQREPTLPNFKTVDANSVLINLEVHASGTRAGIASLTAGAPWQYTMPHSVGRSREGKARRLCTGTASKLFGHTLAESAQRAAKQEAFYITHRNIIGRSPKRGQRAATGQHPGDSAG